MAVTQTRPVTTSAKKSGEASQVPRVMVGRQPILDRRRQVYGYELLFRSTAGPETAGMVASETPFTIPADVTPEEAAAHVIADGVLSIGLDKLTNGRRAFVELTPEFLRHDVVRILPPDQVVLQLSCDGPLETSTIDICRELRLRGYGFALNRFQPEHAPLLPCAAFVKLDYRSGGAPAMAALGATSAALIAGGIDTTDAFQQAVRDGFTHFQGFFFERPSAVQTRAIPRGQIGYLRLLCALNDPNMSLDDLEDLMKRDASLCYRMLRTVNSAGFAQSREITSIRHALLLLGRDTIRRWASLWVMADLGAESHAELTLMSSVRGRFCELLAAHPGGSEAGGDGFLLGMCSSLDVILERPMAAVVEELPLSTDTIAALLGRDNGPRRLLDCVIAYERGDFETSLGLAALLGLDPRLLPPAHAEALTWAQQIQRPPAGSDGR
jgi:EAL and modified HD-GYP domain-containing signal transduction protein